MLTVVIIGAGCWDCMSRNLSLSITARIDRGVTCYESERGRCCISINEDHGRSLVGASGLELGLSGRERPRSGKDLGGVEASK